MQYATDISRRMSGDDNDDDDDNDNDDAVSTDDNITDLDENAGGLQRKPMRAVDQPKKAAFKDHHRWVPT